MTIDNQWYSEAFRSGVRAAPHISRDQANTQAHSMPVREGDAYLAGFYAERRRMRQEDDEVAYSRHEDSASYRSAMIDAGRGRLLR